MTTALIPRPAALAVPLDAESIAAAWLAGYSNDRTRRAYARDLAQWGDWLAQHGISDPLQAHRVHVDLWARALEQAGAADASIARRLAALSRFYDYAIGEGAIDRSPLTNVARPKSQDDSPTLGLDAGELARLLATAEASSPRDHALTLLLSMNGLRVSEVTGASAEDLSTERGHRTLTVTRKGGKRALAPLAPRTSEAIARYLDGRTTGPMFITRTGRPLLPGGAYRTVVSLARRAGIDKHITPHSLRHSFVTLALDSGASLRDVQDAAGHADPRTTRRYDRARHNLDRHPTYAIAAAVG